LITNAVDLGTVLGIWAHPDDETFLSAGLMAAAREADKRVVCATATLGEHGTDDPQLQWDMEVQSWSTAQSPVRR
jgi:LmbE family N-acetylglucosaminyl deacetylase